MSNCPCVPYGKKCVFEEHHKDLIGCCINILNYHLQELKMELPFIGDMFKPYECKWFLEESEDTK